MLGCSRHVIYSTVFFHDFLGDLFNRLDRVHGFHRSQHVLHDWDDEDCVKILTRCRKAIHTGGKVIIVDMVVGSSPSKDMLQVQLQFDLLMMAVTSGKERDEQQWHKIFMDAGFSNYERRPVMGFTSITQLYP